MINFIPDIQLSAAQILLVLLGCGYLVWCGRPEWAMGIYMATAAWTRSIMFGPVAHTWVFLAVAVLASISYILRKGRLSLFPPQDRWIVAWMGLWWGWMMALIILLEDPGLRWNLARNFLCYVVAPMPLFLLLAGEIKRARGFAIVYILTTLVGGWTSLQLLEITNAMLLADPTLSSERSVQFLGLYNYHFFSFAQGNSLILTTALFRENRNIVIRLALLAGAAGCVYFMMMAGSRQAVIGVFLALGVFVGWMLRQRGRSRSLILLLGTVFFLAVLMFLQAPQLMRAEHSSLTSLKETLADGLAERWELWRRGLNIFAGSPVWGTGFKDQVISHNLFISTLADQGIMGMLYFLGFLAFFVRQVQGVWKGRGPKDLALWRMAFLCVVLFCLFHAQASGNVISSWELYWSTAFLWHLGWAYKKSVLAYLPRSFAVPAGIVTGQPR
jgi:hypothetical protein